MSSKAGLGDSQTRGMQSGVDGSSYGRAAKLVALPSLVKADERWLRLWIMDWATRFARRTSKALGKRLQRPDADGPISWLADSGLLILVCCVHLSL
jgi:hypothetical protein